jgi:hypothetical protein
VPEIGTSFTMALTPMQDPARWYTIVVPDG